MLLTAIKKVLHKFKKYKETNGHSKIMETSKISASFYAWNIDEVLEVLKIIHVCFR